MPAASALSCAELKKMQLLSAPMRGHHNRTNENPHEWLRFFVLGDDHGGTAIATVIHSAMCPTTASLTLHSYVFCEAPPVDVRRFFHVPYIPVGDSVPRIDFVDHVAIIVGAFPHPWADAAGAELDIGAIGLTAKQTKCSSCASSSARGPSPP